MTSAEGHVIPQTMTSSCREKGRTKASDDRDYYWWVERRKQERGKKNGKALDHYSCVQLCPTTSSKSVASFL